jgi:hypothetical protein
LQLASSDIGEMDVRKHRPLIELVSLALGMLLVGPKHRYVILILFFIYKLITFLCGDFLYRVIQTLPRDIK